MIKYLFVLFNLVAIFFYNLFFIGEVTAYVDSPSSADAGSEFIVKVTIEKGDIAGFAKLQVDLPKGLTAEAVETNGASFTFNKQSAKFIWTELPSNKEFVIKYKVLVEAEEEGIKDFGGKFSYVLNNEKFSIEIPESSVLITEPGESPTQPVAATEPNKKKEPETVATNTEPEKKEEETPVTTSATEPKKKEETVSTNEPTAIAPTVDVTASRYMPEEANESFVVRVTINKGDIEGFAKLQENIPDGFTVEALETANSTFTFADQQAKFVWITLPNTETISVSYKVKVGANLIAQKSIDGAFSYLEQDETKKVLIQKSSIFVNNQGSGPADEPIATKEPEDIEPQEDLEDITTSLPSAQKGVDYKVQICALLKSNAPTSYFSNTYNIYENINVENHEGWVKYTVGKFDKYKGARDHRESIRAKGIKGPFVTAYNTGKRITVQEALLITNQQWYK